MTKRVLSFILAALMILLITACSETSVGENDETTAAGGETTTAEEDGGGETIINWASAGLPTVDYEGRKYTVLYSGTPVTGQAWRYIDTDETTGEVLNDAIFDRNRKIEDIYNIDIETVNTSSFSSDIKTSVTANDGAYDAVFGQSDALLTLAQNANLLNWMSMPYIDVDAQWWDSSVVEGFTVDGRLYLCTGDISPFTNVRVYSLVFNKDLCRELGLELPYQYVLDGKWTIDVFSEYIADVNRDVNGDSKMDYDDQWGYLSQDGNSYMMYFSGGGRVAELNSDGEWQLSFTSNRNIELAIKALEVSIDDTKTLMANTYVNNNGGSWAAASAWFAAGGSLMRSSVFEPVPRDYRTMDTDFGVLPYPKLSEDQESYYTLPEQTSMMFAFPLTCTQDFSGIITESLAAESVSTVSAAFYDVCLNGKVVRDEESKEMLDIIFGNKVFDIGYFMSFGSITTTLTSLEQKNSTDVASSFEKNLKSATKLMEKFLSSLEALDQ